MSQGGGLILPRQARPGPQRGALGPPGGRRVTALAFGTAAALWRRVRLRRANPVRDGQNRMTSLHNRLSVLSFILFALVTGLGVFTIHLFSGFNTLSDELRTGWLPTTRYVGDLNNYTSDFRAAEGDFVLAEGAAEREAQRQVVAALGLAVAKAQHDFEAIDHPREELVLYDSFAAHWRDYRAKSAHVMELATADNHAAAKAYYRTESRQSYAAVSDALGLLTARNVEWARAAGLRTARAYVYGRDAIVIAIIAAGGILGLALLYIRRWISSPLVRLAHAMQLLAKNITEIEIDGTARADEIGDMARAVVIFRANAIDLVQSQRGLAQQAAMLEQKLAYEQHLTQQQRNFVSMISHEFRTPLTIIDAHAQRLVTMKDRITPGDLADRAKRVRSAVQRMTGLMENLLNSSRLMDGETKLFLHPERFDLAVLLHEVCNFHRETSPNAYIRIDAGHQPILLVADRNLMFQTVSNLLSNAIKYSHGDIAVHVLARRQAGAVTLSIRDKGLGIPAADLGNLFTRYYRGRNVSGIVGTGVGLYLAKTVVTLHGGDITVTSTEGAGACFTITLPDKAPDEAASAAIAALAEPASA